MIEFIPRFLSLRSRTSATINAPGPGLLLIIHIGNRSQLGPNISHRNDINNRIQTTRNNTFLRCDSPLDAMRCSPGAAVVSHQEIGVSPK